MFQGKLHNKEEFGPQPPVALSTDKNANNITIF